MSARAGTGGGQLPSQRQARWLFIASCIALVATAMFFGVRADVLASQREEFGLSNQAMGWITGMAFWGFAVAIIIGGAIVDFIGMKAMLVIAFAAHVAGIVVTVVSGSFWPLFVGTLLVGLGNGAVEAAVNPMIASAYPNRKTARLNLLHVWFPAGIAIGGVAAYLLTQIGMGWQVKTAIILIPTLVYGAMFLRSFIPESERVEAGIPTSSMFKEVLKPGFLVLVFCMLLTAATELGTNQWLPSILTATAAVSGILVLVWINGLMAVGRAFGGKIVDRISPIGLLIGSASASVVGLLLLSVANSAIFAFVAATVFAVGICYFWPTMLGVTSERFPAGGALVLGIMGGVGNISVALVMPVLGGVYDASGPSVALRTMTLLPLVLILIFGAIWFRDRARGGYKAEKLIGDTPEAQPEARPGVQG